MGPALAALWPRNGNFAGCLDESCRKRNPAVLGEALRLSTGGGHAIDLPKQIEDDPLPCYDARAAGLFTNTSISKSLQLISEE